MRFLSMGGVTANGVNVRFHDSALQLMSYHKWAAMGRLESAPYPAEELPGTESVS